MTPAQIGQRLNEGVAHHQAGRLERAEAIYRQVAAAAPRVPVVFEMWGRLAEQAGRYEEAVQHYRRAQTLEPLSAPRAIQLASALLAVGRAGEGEKLLRDLAAKQPKSADAVNALGFLLKAQGKVAEALPCHARAVALNPRLVEGWYHFGHALATAGRNFDALPRYEQALALRPDFLPARFGRAQALQKCYRLPEAVAEYRTVLQAQPGHHDARSCLLFALQNDATVSREALLAEHRAYGRTLPAAAPLPIADPDPARRLRVGIVSPDLRTHSCAYFLEPLLRHLDREAFEVFLYHDHALEDAVSARLKTLAHAWRNIALQPHAAVERAIRADQLDVAIDLAGHIGNSIRLPVFARRIAPVQITYLGYPDTTGVPAMDYRFTDGIADPEGEADAFATEKLVRFSSTAWCYQPPEDAPPVEPPPAQGGAPVTFGCFNNPTKFTDPLFAAWGRILAAVPGSRLLLKGRDLDAGPVREALLQRMERQGIPIARVELLPRTVGTAEHLALYHRIDVALDTFPYNGTTTTCEALWMGRPVVTLRGDRHASRVGASLLAAVGRTEWVGTSIEAYTAVAIQLGRQSPRPTFSREQIFSGSDLQNHRGQAQAFARALRSCWVERVG